MNRAASVIVMFLVAACGLSVLICFWPDQKGSAVAGSFLLFAVRRHADSCAANVLVRGSDATVCRGNTAAACRSKQTAEDQRDQALVPDNESVRRELCDGNRVRTTSVRIKAVRIGQEPATELCFEMTDRTTIDRVTIPARDLLYVMVKATFQGIPILHIDSPTEKVAILTFDDVFHGTLEPVIHQL
jgi:hypothetical protein